MEKGKIDINSPNLRTCEATYLFGANERDARIDVAAVDEHSVLGDEGGVQGQQVAGRLAVVECLVIGHHMDGSHD